MIRKIYSAINKAYNEQEYKEVIRLINEALSIPGFGFDQIILWEYGYSLLKTRKKEQGIQVLRAIVDRESNPNVIQTINEIIARWEAKKEVNLPLENYLDQGKKLEPGLLVFLHENVPISSEIPLSPNYVKRPYLIWKVVEDTVYAFPMEKWKKYGYYLSDYRYFKKYNYVPGDCLVTFAPESIEKIDDKAEDDDYKKAIHDLYERHCIFGTIDNKPKNYFVTEMEQELSVEVGDVIAIYDVTDKHRHYYYITEINEEESAYKGIAITHSFGNIALKDNAIVEIPFSTFIMEKVNISPENKKRIEASVALIPKETSAPNR